MATLGCSIVDISYVPAKHGHARNPRDINTVLRGGFSIAYKDTTIYFAGDTARGKDFKEIKRVIKKIDYSIMPIGSYKPKAYNGLSHIDPVEAVHAAEGLQSKHLIPMHFGTYHMSSREPPSEPLDLLVQSAKNSKTRVITPVVGKAIAIKN